MLPLRLCQRRKWKLEPVFSLGGHSGYTLLRIPSYFIPNRNETHVMQTEVSSPSCNPIWNATITFRGISSDTLFDRYIEVILYDLLPQSEPIFLGECNVMLQKAFLDDVAVWYVENIGPANSFRQSRVHISLSSLPTPSPALNSFFLRFYFLFCLLLN